MQHRRIALIDYRAGNLTSVKKAFAAIGADLFVPESPADLGEAAAVVVPGVGHFAATRALTSDWVDAIRAGVDTGRPLLGICLGMQWLFDGSEEAPDCAGLGVLSGHCYRLSAIASHQSPVASRQSPVASQDSRQPSSETSHLRLETSVKIPHVGWNALDIQRDASIVEGVAPGAQVYFTHSFVAPLTSDTVAVTEHGRMFAAIVQRAHVAGVQFHPEKSGDVGLRILRNFMRWVS